MQLSPSVHIAPYRSIAATVAERLLAARGNDVLRPWAEEVIVPSRGMAEAITAEVVARVPEGVAALQIRFIDDLARTIFSARVASDIERRLAMRMAVRNVDHPLMEGRGIAAMLERSYRDVRDSGLTLDRFAYKPVVLRAWREYERLIASFGAIDPADLLMRARGGDVKPQLLAGFYDMTGAQLAFVKSLPLAAVYVPTDMPFARRFILECGGSATAFKAAAEPPHSKSAFDTRYSELRSICAEVAQLISQGETSIAIVARSIDPYDARLLNRFAAEFGFSTTLKEETPLSAHRIGRAVLNLLRLRDRGFPRGEVLELVRDGLHLKTKLNVDEIDVATRKQRVAGGTSAELSVLRNRIGDYIALVKELEDLTANLDLTRLGSLARIETKEDLAAAAALDEIAAVFERANAFSDTDSLIDAIEQATISSTTSGGIWAGTVLQFRGRTFKHLFVFGMQDDVFPQGRFEDPLIPDADRARLGVREIGNGTDEEKLLFQLLLDSADNVRFTYATGDGFAKVLRPSRFIRRAGASPAPAGHPARPPATIRQLQLLAKSGTESIFDGYVPAIAASVEAKLQTVSPTQLEDFGECPHKFLLKHILGVEDLEDPEREIQVHHRDKGTLDHRVLERFYRGLTDEDLIPSPQLSEKLVERLDRLIDEAFDNHENDVPAFNKTVRGIERRATKRILREFVTADLADLHVNGLTPRHFEYQFGAVSARRQNPSSPAFTLPVANSVLRVEGTIDRIDTGDERFRIVDYKSGKALRHDKLAEKIDRGVRLQLALYAMAAANIFGIDAANVSGTIKPIVTGEGKPRFAFALHEKQERLLETLALFTTAIKTCVFPAFPGREDDVDSCKYCPVNHSCRTKHDLDERYAIQQRRDPRTLLSGAP